MGRTIDPTVRGLLRVERGLAPPVPRPDRAALYSGPPALAGVPAREPVGPHAGPIMRLL